MELTQDDVVRILKLIDEAPVGRFSLHVGDLKLEVVKGRPGEVGTADGRASQPTAVDAGERTAATAAAAAAPAAAPAPPAAAVDDTLLAIAAPLLGIFYRRPQPGAPPYVEEGSVVDEDTTVALIEVMKLFNPVKAGLRGRIKTICAENGGLVEYGQTLFLVEPE